MSKGHYKTAQICMNGHVLTENFAAENIATNYCETCGAKTITQCQSCGANIRGYFQYDGIAICAHYTRPNFCYNCGKPYPWAEEAMVAAKELAMESEELTEKDADDLEAAMADIMQDGPRTEVASVKIKKIAKKAGSTIGGAIEKIAINVATEAAKQLITSGMV